ncbi:unnamed protein product [Parascedosporium putredinis]|uniref:Exonuclease domain-containing protein n=1 Tax=Parascedosporium putredinis TaxID=1442378 RepID=A0A9P1MCJ6_9PEZI|nr:unnamed protein product [Parascedosporium putredinis]CAI7998536.1 unnamed protein product [Parascedosporium putredinis]
MSAAPVASTMPSGGDGLLVWIDCEMTGLDPTTDEILEIHCQITSPTLEPLDPAGYTATVHVPAARLDRMSEWCRTTHAAAAGLLAYVRRFAPEPRSALLAGNTVHMDKMFLMQEPYRPVIDHLHYRILDVSAIKEAAKRWCPADVVAGVPAKRVAIGPRMTSWRASRRPGITWSVCLARQAKSHDHR